MFEEISKVIHKQTSVAILIRLATLLMTVNLLRYLSHILNCDFSEKSVIDIDQICVPKAIIERLISTNQKFF